MHARARLITACLAALLVTAAAQAEAPRPIAEGHTHYNWNQHETLPPDEAVQRLKDNNVVFVVVASSPPELALKLREAGGDWIVPIFSPYLTPTHRHNWYQDPKVLEQMEAGLASGEYHGIGEVHMLPGLGPRTNHPAFLKTLDLARQYDVPYMIHTDASSYKYLLSICQQHSDVRFVWAHAGGILPPEQVGALLEGCPNVAIDLSARDPMRHTETQIIDETGSLLPGWRDLVIRYSDRVIVGADPVWPVYNKHAWDEPDTGWDKLEFFLDFHRRWISDLPEEIQDDIQVENAKRIYTPRR
ncbi:MAG TPA: hypothetical protein ENN42_01320 [Thioalkalivibrio sp.]|nr:hypothetical protein [Thioalkalivibrio sp.]